jgi:hypothetical protein
MGNVLSNRYEAWLLLSMTIVPALTVILEHAKPSLLRSMSAYFGLLNGPQRRFVHPELLLHALGG